MVNGAHLWRKSQANTSNKKSLLLLSSTTTSLSSQTLLILSLKTKILPNHSWPIKTPFTNPYQSSLLATFPYTWRNCSYSKHNIIDRLNSQTHRPYSFQIRTCNPNAYHKCSLSLTQNLNLKIRWWILCSKFPITLVLSWPVLRAMSWSAGSLRIRG